MVRFTICVISHVNLVFKDEPLGGWIIQRVANGNEDEAVEYKFTPKYVLKAEQSVTVSFTCFIYICIYINILYIYFYLYLLFILTIIYQF